MSGILFLSLRSFFCNITHHALRLARPVSDYFCYSMGAIISLFSLVFFLKTCVYILAVSERSVYSMEEESSSFSSEN